MALRNDQDERNRRAALRDETAPLPERERVIESPSVAPDAPEPPKQSLVKRHPYIAGIVAVLLLAAIGYGVVWWLNARNYVSSDDAFIDTRSVQISSQVTGAITEVPVTDNQFVEKGALLVRIDARDYEAALKQAQAQLEQAKASVANVTAQIAAQQANIQAATTSVTQAEAALTFSQQQFERAQRLLKSGAGTQLQEQQTRADLTQKQAAHASAQATLTAAQKQLAVLQAQKQSAEAQVDAAQAAVNTAEINVNRTTLNAPVAGRVANLNAAVGSLAQPGATLLTLVPREVWVTANFKETELGKIKVGDPAEITVDAYPGRTFQGRVASIQAGSGTAFSLLPAQNATGNYVKIVQRVPVKITFDELPDVYLGPGMSVVPTVKVK
jgi:membrane fusion protein (multidrug efflux system)